MPVFKTAFAGSESPLSEGGAWNTVDGRIIEKVEGQARAGNLETECAAFLTGEWGADQWAEADQSIDGDHLIGPMVRADINGSGYIVWANQLEEDELEFTLNRVGSFTGPYVNLGFFIIPGIPVRHKLRISSVGTTIKCYYNGQEMLSVTDSGISSGVPGIFITNFGEPEDAVMYGFEAVSLTPNRIQGGSKIITRVSGGSKING